MDDTTTAIKDIAAAPSLGESPEIGAWGAFVECEKCKYGSGDHDIEFCGPTQRVRKETWDISKGANGGWLSEICDAEDIEEDEHFHRTCTHCGYIWIQPIG